MDSAAVVSAMRCSYDWQQAFDFAARGAQVSAGSTCSAAGFDLSDVDVILAASEGENDAASWVCCGRLDDGRYFYVTAWCDYTGWDCRSGGTAYVADTIELLWQFGMDDEGRRRLPEARHA